MKTLILDGTAISLQAALTTSAATTNPTFVTNYADNSGSGITEGATDGVLNGSTDVTIVPAPSGANRRIIKNITIFNGDTAAVTVLIKYDNNATQRTLVKVTLAVGDTWTTEGVFDSSGNLKQITGNVNLATNVTGTLPVANGGSGATTLTGVLKGNGTSAFTAATAGTDYVTPTGTETLTNKTLTDPALIGTILEDIFTITDGAAFEIDPGNGSIQLITLGANRTPKATNFANGESVVLMVDDGTAYALTWTDTTFGTSGVVWKTNAGVAPTLNTTGYTVIVLWEVASQVYGARVGDA
jgi:hypothetical protein